MFNRTDIFSMPQHVSWACTCETYPRMHSVKCFDRMSWVWRGWKRSALAHRLRFSRLWMLEPSWDSIQPGQAICFSLPLSLPLPLHLLLLHLLENVFVWPLALFTCRVQVCLPGSVSVGTETDSPFVHLYALSSRNNAVPCEAVRTFKEET